MSGKCSLIIFANMMIMFVKSENNGNTLVNCAACQSVQVQDWSCDVNCHIIKGTNDEVVTYGVIQELMEKMDSLNETLNQEITDLKQENENLNLEMMNLTQKINKLENSTCAFSVQGSGSGTQVINSNTVVFEQVDLNVCDAYDVTTGIFTATKAGTYMFSAHVRSGSNRGGLAIKKNNVVICKLWVTESHGSNIPSGNAVTHLVPGDQVKVTGDDVDAATIDVDYKGFSGIQVDTD